MKMNVEFEELMKSRLNPSEKKVVTEYSKAKSQLDLPRDFKQQVLVLYRKLSDQGDIIARERSSNVASLVYIVSRLNNVPVLLEDLADAFGVNKKRIFRFLKKNIRALNIHLKPEDPMVFLDRYADELGIKNNKAKKAREIIKKMKLSGKSIKALVISVLYHVGGLDPLDISKRFGISPYTLRKYSKNINDVTNNNNNKKK
jgi:transcription initiation factor TFIIB